LSASRQKRNNPKKETSRLWIWAPYVSGEGYAIGVTKTGLPETVARQLLLGEPIAKMPRRFTVYASGRHLPDMLHTPTTYPAVSDRVREVLERMARVDLQFVPVHLPGWKVRYWLPHVRAELALIDRARSRRLVWDPDDSKLLLHVGPMVLRDPPPGAPLYFRLAEAPSMLILADELKVALEQASSSPGHFFAPPKFGY
jgi:hypothetical protein